MVSLFQFTYLNTCSLIFFFFFFLHVTDFVSVFVVCIYLCMTSDFILFFVHFLRFIVVLIYKFNTQLRTPFYFLLCKDLTLVIFFSLLLLLNTLLKLCHHLLTNYYFYTHVSSITYILVKVRIQGSRKRKGIEYDAINQFENKHDALKESVITFLTIKKGYQGYRTQQTYLRFNSTEISSKSLRLRRE